MPVDGIITPVPKLFFEVFDGRLGLQSQRIATEINRRVAVFLTREIERLPLIGERIVPVHPGGICAAVFVIHVFVSPGFAMTVPHTSHVRFRSLS